ncbi:16S rRNA (uracil(1498)-N(3))-methyltransferase [Citricoccus sp. SGAir0253]|uniref:16S rRNA (uracil(1498)-N(3))-methyltransferase n=1 Tax=Citricoccus sp. SGAir0253 TaxID=2567881 RepID=UPI0010CCE89D|nr:16S rRNA (uracil(1498)-N(3))-methyltransferase [Citricoccus sp. SGAir0253]QCU78008.1 16S rRNA (uracil(1498)-N(3))-methyltransferase [Citricoccus sp. SGAir0253]
MSHPLFYAGPGALTGTRPGDAVVLTGAEARHAAQSMRLGVGEHLDVADGSGRRVTATVRSADADRLEATAEQVTDEPAPRPELVLVQALAKGDRDLMGVQAATELGVDAVHPWQAERSIVRWTGGGGKAAKTAKALAKWEAALLAAAKQARRTRVPAARELLDGVGVASVCGPGTLVLMLHEDATEPLGDVLAAAGADAERIVMVVGPEGGISPAEARALAGAGARPVLLGRNVLRSSTAGPAATAVVQQLLGRFGARP